MIRKRFSCSLKESCLLNRCMVIHSSSPISDSRRRFPHEKTALGADFAAAPADRLGGRCRKSPRRRVLLPDCGWRSDLDRLRLGRDAGGFAVHVRRTAGFVGDSGDAGRLSRHVDWRLGVLLAGRLPRRCAVRDRAPRRSPRAGRRHLFRLLLRGERHSARVAGNHPGGLLRPDSRGNRLSERQSALFLRKRFSD